MKHTIHLGDKPVVLIYKDFEEDIDVNEMTKIDYSNLYGESITISVLLNRIGQLRAEAEAEYERRKLTRHITEGNLEKKWRKEAAMTTSKGMFTIKERGKEPYSIKLTDKSVAAAISSDEEYELAKKNEISANRDLGYLDSLFWALKSKDKKLSMLLPQNVPEDFYNEIVEGSVNGIMIRKPKNKI
jgi:hypothetical protein